MLYFVIGFLKFFLWFLFYFVNYKSISVVCLYEFEVDCEYFKVISLKNDSFSNDFFESYLCLVLENI